MSGALELTTCERCGGPIAPGLAPALWSCGACGWPGKDRRPAKEQKQTAEERAERWKAEAEAQRTMRAAIGRKLLEAEARIRDLEARGSAGNTFEARTYTRAVRLRGVNRRRVFVVKITDLAREQLQARARALGIVGASSLAARILERAADDGNHARGGAVTPPPQSATGAAGRDGGS